MATRALRPYRKGAMRVHFVSNIDPADLGEVLEQLYPGSTLFIIASKTFTTLETLTNAEAAKRGSSIASGILRPSAATSSPCQTNLEATRRFGIDDDRVFEFWDWAGGRFSLWSAIGLPIALCMGMDAFEALPRGRTSEWTGTFERLRSSETCPRCLRCSRSGIPIFSARRRMPWYRTTSTWSSCLPICSNWRWRATASASPRRGQVIDYATAPVLWGASGTNGQHAFFQLLHQGTVFVPVDFMTPLQGYYPIGRQQELLFANCVAQSEALMRGKSEDEVLAELRASGLAPRAVEHLLPHKVFPGNKPSNTLVYERLTPETLGALIAAYEHKTFVEGVIWGSTPSINGASSSVNSLPRGSRPS